MTEVHWLFVGGFAFAFVSGMLFAQSLTQAHVKMFLSDHGIHIEFGG